MYSSALRNRGEGRDARAQGPGPGSRRGRHFDFLAAAAASGAGRRGARQQPSARPAAKAMPTALDHEKIRSEGVRGEGGPHGAADVRTRQAGGFKARGQV